MLMCDGCSQARQLGTLWLLADARGYSSLPSGMPTVYPQIRTRHKTTRTTHQEHPRAPILLRPTQFPQHILRWPVSPALRILFEQLFHHGRHDVARGNGVDADAMGAPFGGEVARELDEAGFGGVVGGADEALGQGFSKAMEGEGEEGESLRGWQRSRSWTRSSLCFRRGRGGSFLSLRLAPS